MILYCSKLNALKL